MLYRNEKDRVMLYVHYRYNYGYGQVHHATLGAFLMQRLSPSLGDGQDVLDLEQRLEVIVKTIEFLIDVLCSGRMNASTILAANKNSALEILAVNEEPDYGD